MSQTKNALKFISYVFQQYREDGCSQRAAALTYTSLFAVVPLITVMYAMLSLVPRFQHLGVEIEQIIFAHFIPSTGQDVQQYIHHFSEQAQELTGLGIAFLAVTAWLMLKSIEDMFEVIWTVSTKRRGWHSFIMHWLILSFGPILIGIALFITSYLMSLKVINVISDGLFATPLLLFLAPYGLMSLALTLLYAFVPNCPVKFKHALYGGLLTTLTFEVARLLFSWIVSFTSIEFIYGAFAAIPLFLIWIYTSWLIVLAGAEWVHALGYHQVDYQKAKP
ncbi:MAG: membrane protein [Pseudohongiellaceae bacterium]|jgi:membrane protein